jgi:hypothetical protein
VEVYTGGVRDPGGDRGGVRVFALEDRADRGTGAAEVTDPFKVFEGSGAQRSDREFDEPMKGEITWRKKQAGIKRNRDAITGKMALYACYESMGMANSRAARDLLNRIYRLRVAMKNRTGDDDR